MSRADTAIVNYLDNSVRNGGQSNHIIRTAAGVLYYFYTDGAAEEIWYVKSSNYGLTWSPAVAVTTGSQIESIAVWFDQWTPGDSGTFIHLAYLDITSADVLYRSLDTASDTLSSAIVAYPGTSYIDATNCLTITKTKAGRVVIVYDIDGTGAEAGAAKANDAPVTGFTAIANPVEAANDFFLAAPGNYADTADFDLIYWDRSATEITMKTYDDSGNSWSESAAIGTGMTSLSVQTAAPQFSISVRPSDSHLILAAWSASDTANADLRLWDINGAASITEKTNVVLNSTDDQTCCGVGIDATNDDLYVFYLGKSDGSETCYTALNCYYKVSTDDGTTWGSELRLSTITRPLSMLHVCPNFSNGEFYAAYGGTHQAQLQESISAFYQGLPAPTYQLGV